MGALGAWEFYRLARHLGIEALDTIGITIAAAVPLYAALDRMGVLRSPAAIAAVVFLTVSGMALWARGVQGRPLEAVAATAFGAAYAGAMLTFAYLLRHHRYVVTQGAGTVLLLYPVVLTWASDIGAYFVGRALGKARLMPSVSPGKTRAGAWGALGLTVVVSLLWIRFALRPVAQLALTPIMAVVFGLVVSVAAQVGDLFESMLKREAGVKDSSHLLPGHGGILDRLDSLYFVLPVAYLILGSLLIPSPA